MDDKGDDDVRRRLVVCLIADERVTDRFPIALRYLQVGLIDEAIDTILVLPEDSRTESLAAGPTRVILHRAFQWPLAGRGRRAVIAEVQRQLGADPRDASIIIHGLAGSAASLASDLAAEIGADLLLNIGSSKEIDAPHLSACLDRVSAILTPSEVIQRLVLSSTLAGKPVEVVRFGTVVSGAPAAFNAPQLAPALVFAGALSTDCGVDTLLRAAKRVLQHHPNLLIFIIGKGPAESRLRHLVETLDMRPAVTFTGRLEHWRHVLDTADIFCLPSSQTVFREELVHAFAAGLAVVAAENAIYDGLTHQQTALLFPQGDEVLLAEQIRRFLDQPAFARSVAATAQAYARSNHSVARMVADHVRIYRQLESRGSTFSIAPAR